MLRPNRPLTNPLLCLLSSDQSNITSSKLHAPHLTNPHVDLGIHARPRLPHPGNRMNYAITSSKLHAPHLTNPHVDLGIHARPRLPHLGN
ncbi:hypothetical protein PGT21_008889 [Puccinia graminis f. sp. tritici]|uniref:Uncharacterized protein n=1 Tax=Puccinia graminis f. sp. tritici TaxID=56615 RepID=A0A5B0MHV1_PUCGR|nr:hypothetical protein PGT21_008889 [Puccinia graminis f. sp. tritici]